MNLADLIASDEHVADTLKRISRQRTIIRRLRLLGASPQLIETAEQFQRALLDCFVARCDVRNTLAGLIHGTRPNSVMGAMYFGLSIPHLTLDDLPELA